MPANCIYQDYEAGIIAKRGQVYWEVDYCLQVKNQNNAAGAKPGTVREKQSEK